MNMTCLMKGITIIIYKVNHIKIGSLLDLTNQRRAQGMSVDQALREACPVRMRPVLMTSATLILALA
ncbi:MAG TPA: hypothetical protein VLB84_18140, partial [Bacteroidia bacterium]|nr:hypothetical protein [Bacteroidia bacterium]